MIPRSELVAHVEAVLARIDADGDTQYTDVEEHMTAIERFFDAPPLSSLLDATTSASASGPYVTDAEERAYVAMYREAYESKGMLIDCVPHLRALVSAASASAGAQAVQV